MKRNQKGFTVIELIVVIAIIAILSTLVFVRINDYRNKAKVSRAKTEAQNLSKALSLFYAKYGDYPATEIDGCGPEDGYCEKIIDNGMGDPYWEDSNNVKHYLSEFYKFKNDTAINAQFFMPQARYEISLNDETGDNKIDCGYIELYARTCIGTYCTQRFYGWEPLICSSPLCPVYCSNNYQPFRSEYYR